MNIHELKAKLEEMKIPKDAYCLEGGLPNDTFCIEKSRSGWEVYYSERGNRNDLRIFDSEQKACDYFFGMIVKSLKSMNQFKHLFSQTDQF